VSKLFALIGAAGFIAKQHVKAIKDIGGELVIAYDKAENVGYLQDSFKECIFTTKERELWKYSNCYDYVVICTPNNTHMNFIKKAASRNKKIICEKPLVIREKDFAWLALNGIDLSTILQLRYFEKEIRDNLIHPTRFTKFDFNYWTPRGMWYEGTWKSDKKKSGGLLFNIGIHPIDLLVKLFGRLRSFKIDVDSKYSLLLDLSFNNAQGKLHISINSELLPVRRLWTNNGVIELSGERFKNLHSKVYKDIMLERAPGVLNCKDTFDAMFEINRELGK
jgi:UDP-N-acetyl-2-amino-2-deoxyglucuronate dehydrogenase